MYFDSIGANRGNAAPKDKKHAEMDDTECLPVSSKKSKIDKADDSVSIYTSDSKPDKAAYSTIDNDETDRKETTPDRNEGKKGETSSTQIVLEAYVSECSAAPSVKSTGHII